MEASFWAGGQKQRDTCPSMPPPKDCSASLGGTGPSVTHPLCVYVSEIKAQVRAAKRSVASFPSLSYRMKSLPQAHRLSILKPLSSSLKLAHRAEFP